MKTQNILFDLLDNDFFDKYMYEIISDTTKEKIKEDLIRLIQDFDIPVSRDEIEITIQEFGINVNVSELLNERLIILEETRPECFI